MQAQASRLREVVSYMTETVGLRLAGSENERRAAEYLREQMALSTPHATIEYFPVNERVVDKEELQVFVHGEWRSYIGSLLSSSVSTNGETVEADLVFTDMETARQCGDLSFMTGKGVVHWGVQITDESYYKALVAAKPAFLLVVDTRFPTYTIKGDGLFPAFVAKYSSRPTFEVTFLDAWDWKAMGATKARLCVSGGLRKSQTSVVIGEIRGTDPDAGILYAGGHHDTQADTPGADDNAIGSAAVVELARMLSEKPHRRTIRLISFGAEEQLSVGSASYVRAHHAETEQKGVFMCNYDSFGSALGTYELYVNGTPAMEALVKERFNAEGVYYVQHVTAMPYTDQFPFAACGVPGIWVGRNNCTSGAFYHHRTDNTIDKIDFDAAARCVTAGAKLLSQLADTEDVTQYAGIPGGQRAEIASLFQEVYGGF